MYILTIEDNFSSAHQLRGYKGKCENIHGHNWKVVLSVKGLRLDDTGLLIDFHELKALLKAVTDRLDHKNLNDLEYFQDHNPSSENIARFIFEEMMRSLEKIQRIDITMDSLTVWESETSRCTYKPD